MSNNKCKCVVCVCVSIVVRHRSYLHQLLHCLPLVAVSEDDDDDVGVVAVGGGDGGRRSDSFSLCMCAKPKQEESELVRGKMILLVWTHRHRLRRREGRVLLYRPGRSPPVTSLSPTLWPLHILCTRVNQALRAPRRMVRRLEDCFDVSSTNVCGHQRERPQLCLHCEQRGGRRESS